MPKSYKCLPRLFWKNALGRCHNGSGHLLVILRSDGHSFTSDRHLEVMVTSNYMAICSALQADRHFVKKWKFQNDV